MKWISTTIKKKWLDEILAGRKTSELKGATDFWKKRLHPLRHAPAGSVAINLLCGRTAVKFKVKYVLHWKGPCKIDGVDYNAHYEICLGDRIE